MVTLHSCKDVLKPHPAQKYNPQSLQFCPCVTILLRVKNEINTLRRIFSSVFVQSDEACVLFLSQSARLFAWSKLVHVDRVSGYSVGVVATGLRMGLSNSLIGLIGEIALWLKYSTT